jgi:hypothetical protein
MVNPITGPFVVTTANNSRVAGSFRIHREGWRQAKPYTLPLPYVYNRTLVASLGSTNCYAAANVGMSANDGVSPPEVVGQAYNFNCGATATSVRMECLNKARARFIEKLGAQASLGITLVQHRQAVDMIANRAGQLLQVFKALRKGDVAGAGKVLGKDLSPTKYRGTPRSAARGGANIFLEYVFGWAPLVGDIQSAVDVLQGPIPLARVKGTAVIRHSWSYPRFLAFEHELTQHVTMQRALVQADVSVSNANLYLANKLGLVNWASVVYDAIPWSFVVGWFVNVEQFLAQYTDLQGLKVEKAFHLEAMHDIAHYDKVTVSPIGNPCVGSTFQYVYEAWSAQRTLGIPAVSFKLKPWSLSVQRALTAVSLLVQKGIKGRA